MLKDDAIREGLIEPSAEDIARMGLKKADLDEIASRKATAAPAATATAPAAGGTEAGSTDQAGTGKPAGKGNK